jgi:hypothetical protein
MRLKAFATACVLALLPALVPAGQGGLAAAQAPQVSAQAPAQPAPAPQAPAPQAPAPQGPQFLGPQPPAGQDVFSEGAAGAAVHRASRFAFPASLGDMPRRKLEIYAADDVAAQYSLRGGGNGDAWVDLIVYPAGRPVAEEARDVEAALVRNFSAHPLAHGPGLPTAADGAIGGWFEGQLQGRAMMTGYVLVKRGRWYILGRASSPSAGGGETLARAAAALAAIDWRWEEPSSTAAALRPAAAAALRRAR